MTNHPKNCWKQKLEEDNFLSEKEVKYCDAILKGFDLRRINHIGRLVNKVRHRINRQNKENEALFELRLATEFVEDAKNIEYEHQSINGSKVDFYCEYKGMKWFIEAVSVRKSSCYSNEENELIRLQRIIGKKVYDNKNKKFIKFGEPEANNVNVIIVDARGFNMGTMDNDDFREALFERTIEPQNRHFVNKKPLKGIFKSLSEDELNAVKPIQQRVHYIVFVHEKFNTSYELEGSLVHKAQPGNMFHGCYIARNEKLLGKEQDVFPFKGVSSG